MRKFAVRQLTPGLKIACIQNYERAHYTISLFSGLIFEQNGTENLKRGSTKLTIFRPAKIESISNKIFDN